VVGKGAFGKVLLVRKRQGFKAGNIYAMKVIKKSDVIDKGQIEHTNAEQAILVEIRHPYIVCLRFSFQTIDKLYLITDYYSGGNLFAHLRQAKKFDLERAKFYAAELVREYRRLMRIDV
jgi:serine/threonine protein kinase